MSQAEQEEARKRSCTPRAHSPLLTLCLRSGSESDTGGYLLCVGVWGLGWVWQQGCLSTALLVSAPGADGQREPGFESGCRDACRAECTFCHATPRTSAQCVSCIQTPGASLAPGGLSLRRCMMVLGCRSGGVRVASSRPRKSHEPKLKHSCGRRCLLSRLSERCAAAGGRAAPPLCLTCGEPTPPSAPAATTRTGRALCPCVGHGEDQGPRAGSSLAMTRATVAGASASPCSAIAYLTALSRLSPDTETAIRGALPGVE